MDPLQPHLGDTQCDERLISDERRIRATVKKHVCIMISNRGNHCCRNHYTKFLLAYEQQMQILASAEGAEAGTDKAGLDASSWPAASSELAAGNGSSVVEDADIRSTAAPDEGSGDGLHGKAIALIQTIDQVSEGIPPLQDGTAVAVQSSAKSLEAKATLMEAGCPETSNELLADAVADIAGHGAAAGGGGLDTAVAPEGADGITALTS